MRGPTVRGVRMGEERGERGGRRGGRHTKGSHKPEGIGADYFRTFSLKYFGLLNVFSVLFA